MALTPAQRAAALLGAPKSDNPAVALLGSAAMLNLANPFLKYALIAGGAAGDHTVTGLVATDSLRLVLYFVGAGVAVTDVSNLTSECTVAAGKINNTGHTNTTGGKLLVVWVSPS